jgi:hypothetical protein
MHFGDGKNARFNRKVLCMNTSSLSRQLLIVGLFGMACVAGTKGGKKMEAEYWPVRPADIEYKERVITIFPTTQPNSFGMVAGNLDNETLRIGKIHDNRIEENVFPIKEFEPYNNIGYCLDDCAEMYLHQSKILTLVNWKKKTKTISYKPAGNMVENEFIKTKIVDSKNKIILSIFSPFYNDQFSKIINNTYSLTLEDLINKKRTKSIPISSESKNHLTDKRSCFRSAPNASFGTDFVIFRESEKYKWLCVNNSLEYIDHPLKDTLNNHIEFFGTNLISLEISPDQPYAVAICQKSLGKNHFPAIIQWNKAPAVMPVAVPLGKDQEIEYSSLQLSPSGRWAYFNTSGDTAAHHYLMYIDTNLPGGCLPPFKLEIANSDPKATWITQPEGFILKVEGKLIYWDLSKFDGNTFLKSQEHDYLQLERNR